MTRVEFIFNVENKLAKAAELCSKAVSKGRQLTISSKDETHFAPLQLALWQQSSTSFLAMFLLGNNQTSALAQQCPIHYSITSASQPQVPLLQDDVLIHFHEEAPLFFSRFRYLVELVGVDAQDKVAARARYKFYRDRGYDIKTTDMANN